MGTKSDKKWTIQCLISERKFYTESEEFTFLIQYYKTNESSPT